MKIDLPKTIDWIENNGAAEEFPIERAAPTNPTIIARGANLFSEANDVSAIQELYKGITDHYIEQFKNMQTPDTAVLEANIAKAFSAVEQQISMMFSADSLKDLQKASTNMRLGVARLAELAQKGLDPAKMQAASTAVANASGLDEDHNIAILRKMGKLAEGGATAEEMQAELRKDTLMYQRQELIGATSGRQFLRSGQYRNLAQTNPELLEAETGSKAQKQLDYTINEGIRGSIRDLKRIESLDKNPVLSFLTGTGSASLGLDKKEVQASLVEGLAATKDQIRKTNERLKKYARELEEVMSSDMDETKKLDAAKRIQEKIDVEEDRKSGLISQAKESADYLNKPLQESLAQMSGGFKTAISAFISGLSQLGDFLYRSIMQLGKATLNPVVTDLFESLKLGLDIGLKAGQLIYTMTKGTLDGMASAFDVGKELLGRFADSRGGGTGGGGTGGGRRGGAGRTGRGSAGGFRGRLNQLGTRSRAFLRNLGRSRFVRGAANVGRTIAGGISRALPVAGTALMAFEGANLLGEGIRALGGNRQNEDGTFTKEGKRNEMWASTLQGAGQGAAIGALVGSIIPGIGTAIGAGIGAGIGGIMGFSKGASVVNDQNAKAAEIKKRENEERRANAYSAGALMLPGLDPSQINTGNVIEKVSGAAQNLGVDLKSIGLGGVAAALGSVAAGNSGVGKVGRNLMAALTGAGGGAFVGMAVASIDFFLKQLNRGAEGMMKFADIGNNINIGLRTQLMNIGNLAAGGLGELGNRNRLTEADLSQYFYDFMQNRDLDKLGYKTEDIGKFFATASQASLMSGKQLEPVVESAIVLSRQLGVSADSLLKAYGDADKAFGIGQGAEMLNKTLYAAAPRSGNGQPNAMSLEIAQALISAGRQLQMSGPQTLSSGKQFTDFFNTFYKGVSESGSDYGDFVKQNPQVLSTIIDSVNNLFKSGITGGNQLGLALSASAGLTAKQSLEFGASRDINTFGAAIGSIMNLLPSDFMSGGKVTSYALENALPIILPNIGLQGPVEGYAQVFELYAQGKFKEAKEAYDKTKPETEQEKALGKLTAIEGGINSLIAEQNRAEQETLKLMENNIEELVLLSRTASDVGNSLLTLSKDFMRPAILELTKGLTFLGTGLDKLEKAINGGNSTTGAFFTSRQQFVGALVDQGVKASDITGDKARSISGEQLKNVDWGQYLDEGSSLFSAGEAKKKVQNFLSGDLTRSININSVSSLRNKDNLSDLYSRYATSYTFEGNLSKEQLEDPSKLNAEQKRLFMSQILGGDITNSGQMSALNKFLSNTNIANTGISALEWLLTNQDSSQAQNPQFKNEIQSMLSELEKAGIGLTGITALEALQDVYGKKVDESTAIATVMGGGVSNNPFLNALNKGDTILLALPDGVEFTKITDLQTLVNAETQARASRGNGNTP